MRIYKVYTPRHGTIKVKADSATQAKYEVARMGRIRRAYPRKSVVERTFLFSARLESPLKNGRLGRPKGSFNV